MDPLPGLNREKLKALLSRHPICGMSFRGAQFPLEETQDILRDLQANANIPYIASDTESSAANALRGGTFIATGAQAGAADDPEVA